MSSGYQPAPLHHQQAFQPDMGGQGHHATYNHLPPPMPSGPYYHGTMPPPRTNQGPPSMSGPRDRGGEAGAGENGMGPNGPSALASKPALEEADKPAPSPIEGTDNSRKYRLECVQQPLRARMCGFGDKDRRPITPPPCIRLIVMDKATGKEVDCNEVEHQHYVLHVDLWSENGDKEVNLVKHSQQSPSISSTQASSYREVVEGAGQLSAAYGYPAIMPSTRGDYSQPPSAGYARQMPHYQQDTYAPGQYGYPQQVQTVQSYAYPMGDYRQNMPGVPQLPSQAMFGQGYTHEIPAHAMGPNRLMGTQSPNGMYTRNLIGSLAASASRLTDPSDKIGIWFILQDLSVRTEGWFRLRFSFINLRRPGAASNGASDADVLNRGRAPVLAQVFSEKFQVYSAKKFPGVCESTALSKCFAVQGVKIPIRKDGQEGKGGKGRGGSDDEDD